LPDLWLEAIMDAHRQMMDAAEMAVSIKNRETERLARELAKRTGVSITEAITTALREQLAREERRRSAPCIRDGLLAIGRRCAALPDLDTRSPDEILGYDEFGLPG
jgi:antitoxin VapB